MFLLDRFEGPAVLMQGLCCGVLWWSLSAAVRATLHAGRGV